MCVCVRACVCVCVCVCVRVGGWAGTCAGGVRFSNSNRIIPSDYRILHLLKMPIPTTYVVIQKCILSACDSWVGRRGHGPLEIVLPLQLKKNPRGNT